MPNDDGPSKLQRLFPESLQVTPAILIELAPRLAPYMLARSNDMSWPAIVEAALFLSGEMGINRTLWARACDVMGREYAAVAMAIVSTRPEGHFTSGPGGYFAGMLRKFEKNPQDLCLGRTLWKLKDEAWGKEGHKERRQVAQARRRPASPEPMKLVGGFVPVGTVLQRQAARPMLPAPRAKSAPVDSAGRISGESEGWKPLPELLEAEERVKAMFSNPQNGTSGVTDTGMPSNGEKR